MGITRNIQKAKPSLIAILALFVIIICDEPKEEEIEETTSYPGKIVFSSRLSSWAYEIYIMDLDGSGQTNLSHPVGLDEQAQFQPQP